MDVYLCGHAHRPEIREVTSAKPDIKQITCGGGTPGYKSLLTFFYGKYDSVRKGIHLEPYIYGFNTKWKKDYNVIDTIEENNFFPFSRLGKSTGMPSQQEKKKDKPTPCIAWNMDRLAWQIPGQWDPNNDTVVPLDDRNALSLPVLLIGNREGYITFLATTVPGGISALLQQREQKYADKYKEWKERNWCECEGTEFVDDGGAGENAGLVICVKAERLIKESLWEMIRRWRDGQPQRAVIVNVWSESPYYAARCAQLAYQYIRNAGASARVFVAAELGEEQALKLEESKELNQWVDALEKKEWDSDECENKEVQELQIYRDECPDKWIALLKRHAKKRRLPGWICGYRASYRIHEYVSQWLAAAGVKKFMREGELDPYISRLREEEMDTLIWEVFRLWEKLPSDNRKYLLKELRDKLLEMGSESIGMLIRIWDSEDEAESFCRLEYPE
ncbi:MAG: hypothetical protein K2L18_00415, partial [Acetatifactor sp.]|nr:hypothetical protein [Acetatifactor sp.]